MLEKKDRAFFSGDGVLLSRTSYLLLKIPAKIKYFHPTETKRAFPNSFYSLYLHFHKIYQDFETVGKANVIF